MNAEREWALRAGDAEVWCWYAPAVGNRVPPAAPATNAARPRGDRRSELTVPGRATVNTGCTSETPRAPRQEACGVPRRIARDAKRSVRGSDRYAPWWPTTRGGGATVVAHRLQTVPTARWKRTTPS